MTTPADLSAALQDIWTVLASAPWQTRPDQAELQFRTHNARLRQLARDVDPGAWPRDVKTYLWRPAEPAP